MKIGMYGTSDDLLELTINGTAVEEIWVWEEKVQMHVRHDKTSPGLVVWYWHGDKGWQASLNFTKDHQDGNHVFPLSMRMAESGYSLLVEFDVPDTAYIRWVRDGRVVAKLANGTIELK